MFVVSVLLAMAVLATCHWYLRRRRLPPGPPAVPLLGSLPFLSLSRGMVDWSLDSRVTRHNLATVSLGPKNLFVINDLKLAKELFEKDEFSGRPTNEWVDHRKLINGKLRGIVVSENENWIKQRRFGLKTLRDLGFGRRSIEQIVNEEIEEIIVKLGDSSDRDGDYLMDSVFNIPIINVLWQLVAGYRFDEKDPEGRVVIKDITSIFQNHFTFATIPFKLLKIFRKKFVDENIQILNNQTKYIRGRSEKNLKDKKNVSIRAD